MIVSFLIAVFFKLIIPTPEPGVVPNWYQHAHWQLLLIKEGASPIEHQLPLEIFCMFTGIITVYATLFATGFWLYDQISLAIIFSIISAIGAIILIRVFGKLKVN
jgi:hypothetical protein